VTPIFRWSGEYFGFLTNTGFLFEARGSYIGWVSDGHQVWSADGAYLGEIVDAHYILRDSTKPSPTPKKPPDEPTTYINLPPRPPDRSAHQPRPGYVDALEPYEREAGN
jgi:hypothetical protein